MERLGPCQGNPNPGLAFAPFGTRLRTGGGNRLILLQLID